MEQATQEEVGLPELLSVIRRRILLIVAVPVAVAAAAWLISAYALTPSYRASTTLWVIQQESVNLDYTTLMTNRDLTTTYAQVARSRSVLERALSNLNVRGLTVEQLQARLSVRPVPDTEIIELSVTDTDPRRAASLADAVAAAFISRLSGFVKLENVSVVDPARLPNVPVVPRPGLNAAVAGAFGLLTIIGLAFIWEYADTTLGTVESIERGLGLIALAAIPRARIPSRPEPMSQPEPPAESATTVGAVSCHQSEVTPT